MMDDRDETTGVLASRIDPSIPLSSLPLRAEEELLDARLVATRKPAQQLSPLDALKLLAGVTRTQDIGMNGPVVAASVLPENKAITELRLYEVLFGRDALITADFVFKQFPELTRTTILRLAELQGYQHNQWSEEEPGRIIHEYRDPSDPIAQRLTETKKWQWPNYGSVDATLLFIRAIVRYILEVDTTFLDAPYRNRQGNQQTIADALEKAVDWLIAKTNENADGLVESRRLNTVGGNSNQAWKDSRDAYHHHDGTLANTQSGIASIEVQALAYDAFHDMLMLYQKRVIPAAASRIAQLESRAEQLRSIILERFWIDDDRGGYFALGTDRNEQGDLQPLAVRSSNMGHLLNSRLLDGSSPLIATYREKLVQTLFDPILLNVSGIRTLATIENRFRPNSYHNGSVWPWDTYAISLGLLRHGYTHEARDLWHKITHVVERSQRYPEFVSGEATTYPRIPNRIIRVRDTSYHFEHHIEQPPQEIQAWTVAAAVAIEEEQKKEHLH